MLSFCTMWSILKIVSGGQTGVDRAALDVALELEIDCGGWCPKGRAAEDGRIDERYPLVEAGSSDPNVRTERNVRDSDATLILTRGAPTGGTAYTVKMAEKHGKPLFVGDLKATDQARLTHTWIHETCPKTLNVAGPRESKCPGIRNDAEQFLKKLLGEQVSG